MSEIIQKLSSYNLLNYLLPGIVFSVLLEQMTSYSIVQKDLFVNAFLFYFIGLCISRIGSVVIETFLKKINFVQFSHYPDFIKASKANPKIEILSEANNTYRTLLAVFVVLVFAKVYEIASKYLSFSNEVNAVLLVLGLFVLFLFSYKKQTSYINKQVEAHKELDNGL